MGVCKGDKNLLTNIDINIITCATILLTLLRCERDKTIKIFFCKGAKIFVGPVNVSESACEKNFCLDRIFEFKQ